MSTSPYPQYESPNGWNSLLPPRESAPPPGEDVVADVLVVGGGFTGLAAARRWAELRPDASIVVIDSSDIGEGNPGRNSGFLLEISLANDADAAQLGRMRQCNQLISRTMHRIRDDVFDGGIDCAIERAGTYRAAAGRAGSDALRKYRAFLDAAGLPYDPLRRRDLADRIGTRYYAEGIFSPHCYLVQPAALIRGLAGLLPANVSIHENTPALRLVAERKRWTVETPGAAVSAPTVIVANNAFAKHLGIARSRLVKMYTYAGLTEQLPDDVLDTLGTERSWGLLPAHRLGCTLRRTRDGRLLIRSHYGYERESTNAEVGKRLLASLRQRYPQIDELRFSGVWGGATGFTLNGAPIWGEMRSGLYVSAGYNGGGVVKGTLLGELLVDHALGRDVPDVKALFGSARWMPPEPLRRLGFLIASRFERRRGRAEM